MRRALDGRTLVPLALAAALLAPRGADAAEPPGPPPSIEEMLRAVGEAPGPAADDGRPAGAEARAAPVAGDAADPALAEFDALLAKGEYRAAKALAERASGERPGGAGGVLAAAAHVAGLLGERRDAMRRALEPRIGGTVTVWTSAGRRKGELVSVSEGGLELVTKTIINREVRGTTRFTVAWSDLTPKEEETLSKGWAVEGPGVDVARAALAVFRGDVEAAEGALVTAGDHPLAAHYRARVDALKAAVADSAAEAAWEKLERRAGAKALSADAARGLIGDLDAFDKEHGRTRFAASSAERIAAARGRAETALAPLLGLVGHWRFDEGRGRAASDASGRGNHAALTGAAWGAGRLRGALLLDGKGDAAVPNPESFNLGTADFTIAAWVMTESDGAILGKAPAAGGLAVRSKLLLIQQNRPRFYNWGIGGLSAGPVVTDGRWHHLAVTFTEAGDVLRLYVDGVPEGSRGLNLAPDVKGHVLRIGATARPSPIPSAFTGAVDDVRIYARALPDAEVAALAGSVPARAAAAARLSPQEVTAVFRAEGSMKLYPAGSSQMHFPCMEEQDAAGPFRGKAAYFDQRTGQDVLYEVRTARPVGRATVRMAAMQNLVIEVLGPAGKAVARTGPHRGGNVWAAFEVKFPPRRRFLMRFHNEVSHWLFIDRVFLE